MTARPSYCGGTDGTDRGTHERLDDTMAKKIPLEERLQRHATAREVGDLVSRGIDHLPVAELTRTMLKYKSSEVIVTLAETGTALSVAARDGVDSFQRARVDETSPEGSGGPTDTPRGQRAGGPSPAASAEDISVRLERLSALHAAGQLDDREYLAAKAKVLGLD